jgi:hypothetical protein
MIRTALSRRTLPRKDHTQISVTEEEFLSYTRALPKPPAHPDGTWSAWSAPWSVGGQLQMQTTFTLGESPHRASASLVVTESELRAFLDANLDGPIAAAYRDTIARAEAAVSAAKGAAPKIVLP